MRRLTGVLLMVLFSVAGRGALADSAGLHSISGVPLYIDGKQSQTHPAALSPSLLDPVKNAHTLGDALRVLGPAYVEPDDSMHIAHWHFQDGTMLTLWPQGGEALSDTVSVYPRPDCGVPAGQCRDLVLGRKAAQQNQQHSGRSGGGSSSGSGMPSMQSLMPLMKMIPGR